MAHLQHNSILQGCNILLQILQFNISLRLLEENITNITTILQTCNNIKHYITTILQLLQLLQGFYVS